MNKLTLPDISYQKNFYETTEYLARIWSTHSGKLFANNCHAALDTIQTPYGKFPLTSYDVRSTISDESWVTSPYSTYYRYVLIELDRHFNRNLLIKLPLKSICHLYGLFMKLGLLDRVVIFNNWLLSTNIYPKLIHEKDLNLIHKELVARYPKHSIWLRSLNDHQHADWLSAAQKLGAHLIPTRQVYLYTDLEKSKTHHQNLKRDLQLLSKTPLDILHHDDFSDADYEEVIRLYNCLYIQKYSSLNPQYTKKFIKAWHQAGLLKLTGFRDQHGKLLAALGLFGSEKMVTAPIVGYDTNQPKNLGLYRLLMAMTYQTCIDDQLTLNLSAGAAHYKKLRGGQAEIEYTAVFSNHLSQRQQRPIKLLEYLGNRISLPIMKRYEL